MLDYKDRAAAPPVRARRPWRGWAMIFLALVILLGGFGFLTIDTLNIREVTSKKGEDSKTSSSVEESAETSTAESGGEAKNNSVPATADTQSTTAADTTEPEGSAVSTKSEVEKAGPSDAEPTQMKDEEVDERAVVQDSDTQQSSDTESKEIQPRAKKPAVPFEPSFDFYTLLPDDEVIIPEEELRTPVAQSPTLTPVRLDPGSAYLLQVGSFRSEAQAEDNRGRLVLLGFEPSIHESRTADGISWYRVRLGPYRDEAELNDIRALLNAEGFRTLALKLRAIE